MNRSHNRSSIFLMELIAAILFFSLVSAMCLRMFIKSSQLSEDTKNLNLAVNQTRNVIELMKHAASPASADRNSGDASFLDCILKEYPDTKQETDRFLVSYDTDWQHCTMEEGRYCLEILPDEKTAENLSVYHIRVFDLENEKDTIYTFNLKLHIPAQS